MASSISALFSSLISQSNAVFAVLLGSVGLRPKHYAFFYPPDTTVEQIETLFDQGIFPSLVDLAPALTYCIMLSLARYVLQHYLIKPFAIWCMQIRETPFQPIADIDQNFPFTESKAPMDPTKIIAYSKVSGCTEESVAAYLRARKSFFGIKKKMVKFVEAFWRAIFYTAFTVLGYKALFQPEMAIWLQDTRHCWTDWPNQPISDAIRFYYLIQLGCYIHQLLWTEVTRSDAMEMIAHHCITIMLILFSYLVGLWRIGSVILLIHDVADIFLETAKVFNYCSRPKHRNWLKGVFVDPIFAVFAVTFFITRLVIYPRFVLYTIMVEGYEHFRCGEVACSGLYFFPALLFALQGLHIFWFYLIARMVYQLLNNQMEKDVRSDDEDDGIEYHGEDEVAKKTN